MSDAHTTLLMQVGGGVASVSLNRGYAMNALSPTLLEELAEALESLHERPDVQVVVLEGLGRAFSVGFDLRAMASLLNDDGTLDIDTVQRSAALGRRVIQAVLTQRAVTIASAHGFAVGGGFGLSLVCDLRIANRGSKYGANFARLGLSSGMGISYILPRLVGPACASELMLTGRLVLGDEAESIGLVNRAVETDEVLPVAMEMAEAIAKNAPIAVRFIKKSIYEGLGWEVRRAAFQEAMAQAITIDTEDVNEGIAALLEKRDPVFHGR